MDADGPLSRPQLEALSRQTRQLQWAGIKSGGFFCNVEYPRGVCNVIISEKSDLYLEIRISKFI